MAENLKNMRWNVRRRRSRVRGQAKQRLCGLLRTVANWRPEGRQAVLLGDPLWEQ